MKLITFNYTDAKGKATKDRTVLQLYGPNLLVSGIDVSELQAGDQVAFLEEMRMLREKYDTAVQHLMVDYDIAHMYRQFKPAQMLDLKDA